MKPFPGVAGEDRISAISPLRDVEARRTESKNAGKGSPELKAIRSPIAPWPLLALIVATWSPGQAQEIQASAPAGPEAALASGETAGKPAKESPVLKAPDFTAKDLQGKEVKASELLKKGPILVDFWTTWCGPCKREMPELDKLHKKYRDRGFSVVAISQDERTSRAPCRR